MNPFRDRQMAEAATRRDDLAERVANGDTLTAAAKAMGVSVQRASQLWRRICADLGPQAV